ncbi:MAG: MBL fold metallo-hydrolase [Candidatus Aminicenantes bacterium]|jgi:glyoxylase-like metal-dependent hydrolase (beta-lactamase superfamily II)
MNRKRIFVIMIFCFAVVNGFKAYGDDLEVVRPCEGVVVFKGGCWSETMTVMDTGKTLVVVDTYASYRLAEKARAYIDKIFNKPVSHVINTHHHWDHTFGNQVFKKAVIIGHKFCLEDMKTEYSDPNNRLRAIKKALDSIGENKRRRDFLEQVYEELKEGFILTPPTLLVDNEYTLKVGDLTFKLYHVPGLHTRSNLTIYVPELGLVFTRINFHQKYFPTLEEGVDMNKLINSLEDILSYEKPVKFIMPGHGSPLPNPDLTIAAAYFKQLWQVVKEAKTQGKSMAQAEGMFNNDSELAKRAEKFSSQHQANLAVLWKALGTGTH